MKISVIIPVYNAAQHLRKCLDSLLAQSYTNWEAYCIDDGSKDESGIILDEYVNKDKRLNVIHQENGGVHVARNRALDVISGDWVIYIDSDDMIAHEWFAEAMRLAAKSQADMVRLAYTFSTEPSKDFLMQSGCRPYEIYEGAKALEYGWKTFFPKGFLWATFVRRSIIGNLKFLPGIRCKEDSIWLIELLPQVKSICVGDFKGYFYRCTQGSLSRGRRTYTQCIAYLFALKNIWSTQKAIATKFGLEESLKECIAASSSNDIIEWCRMCNRKELVHSREIQRWYFGLRNMGALPQKDSFLQTRYCVAFRWWCITGQTIGFTVIELLLSIFRIIARKLKGY